MSWDAYISTQLTASGVICQAAILGKADMQIYAQEGGFALYPSYQANVTKEDGTEGVETIDEVSEMLAFFTSGGTKMPKFGIRMNQVKYQLLKQAEGPLLYLKCSTGGACVAATNALVIVGIYKGAGNEAQTMQVHCNATVEALADYLRQSGW
ncbi:profilin [Tribonema minus]|uniref:Profilin n=1 Tax=Tribonema minus TaxID=303371 RepID=A0A835ZBQ3_9STRA|nr:profilin [Tribonema minus]